VNVVAWWQHRSAARRARVEGRHLVREARRILKKKSYRIPAAVSAEVAAAADAVDASLAGDDIEQQRKTIATLDATPGHRRLYDDGKRIVFVGG